MGRITERIWAEIDLDAIAQNLRYAQVRVGTSVGLLAVVKSDGYGHGAVQVAREAEKRGAKALGVATPGEGVELRQAGVTRPIVVIGSCFEDELSAAIEHGVSLSLSPVEVFWPVVEAARKLGRRASVHLLVDTGMSRDGLSPEQALELAEHIVDTPELELEGTFTHLATSSCPDKTFCREQLDRFNHLLGELLARDISPGVLHCANSGGLFTLPCSHFDMVRQGLTLYGLSPSNHVATSADLVPAMSVRTRVIAQKEIAAGESVGYLREFVADRPTRLATLSIGYADGLRLSLSGKAHVLINGRRAPLVGRVMMNCTVADVTSLPSVRIGDEATVIGRSGRNEIGADEVAKLSGSSSYELVCTFGQHMRRVYMRSGKQVIQVPDAVPPGVAGDSTRLARSVEPLTP